MSNSPFGGVVFLQMGCDSGHQSFQLLLSFDHLGSLVGRLEKLMEDILKLPSPLLVELREPFNRRVGH